MSNDRGDGRLIEVETGAGRLRGRRVGGVDVFRGIPFAAPPVGSLRFKAPQPPQPWVGTRDAFESGPVAMQRRDRFHDLLGYTWTDVSEDCLYLDVFAPANRENDRRPVMVWIHGGAFSSGSGSQPIYDGSRLAREHGVVVVCINYRVGVFGFLRGTTLGPGIDASGNQGLLDQVAALRWVHTEVEKFGGDPTRVTIFGESAGGVAVSTLIGFPPAHGLFQRAIVQSGNAALLNEPNAAEELAERLLVTLDIQASDTSMLYELPAKTLLAAQIEAVGAQQRERPTALPFSPIVDGMVMTEHPLTVTPAPGVAVMGGTTRDEYGLFNLVDPAISELSRERLVSRVRKRISRTHPDGTAEELVSAYEKARGARGESVAPAALWVAIETDRQMRYPILRMLQGYASSGVLAFGYTFAWESPYQNGLLGASHTIELPFIFGTHNLPSVQPYAGTGVRADAVARHTQRAWTSFASTGTPEIGTSAWPPFGAMDHPVAIVSDTTRLQGEGGRDELRAWDSLQGRVKPTELC